MNTWVSNPAAGRSSYHEYMSSLSNAEDRQPHRRGRVAFFGGSFDPPHLGHLGVARAALAALGLDTVLFAPVGTQPLKPQGPTACFEDRLAMTRLAIAGEPAFALSLADAPKSSGAPNFTLETLLALRAQLPPGSTLFCLMGADSFAGFSRWHRAAEIPFLAPLIVASRPTESQWLQRGLDSTLPNGLTIESVPHHGDLNDPKGSIETEGGGMTEGGGGFTASGNTHSESQEASGHDFSRAASATKRMRALATEVRFSADELELRRYILRDPAGHQAPFYLLPGLHIDISASQIRDQIRSLALPSAEARIPDSSLLPPPVLEYIHTHNLYC
ncbi:MAG: nicotinate-nicotinamide nucleotide adenylyltransferase [Terracidiphilus sp.]|jgi:nicotinate-nucleotide adenylyltransferase